MVFYLTCKLDFWFSMRINKLMNRYIMHWMPWNWSHWRNPFISLANSSRIRWHALLLVTAFLWGRLFSFNIVMQPACWSLKIMVFLFLWAAFYLPQNAGDIARKYIKDPELLSFIDAEVWNVVPHMWTQMFLLWWRGWVKEKEKGRMTYYMCFFRGKKWSMIPNEW